MATYKVASPEGADWCRHEEGEIVDLDLTEKQERAVIAAGWLEKTEKKSKEAK
jgi:hypothetical protein